MDAKLRVEMRTELMRLHRATGATSVYVTHDQIEAMTMATHVAVMNKGKVEQFGTPLELVENPQSAFVATFVGTPPANLIPYGASGVRACGKTISMMQVPEAAKTAAHAMFKAERLGITSESKANTLPMELAESSTIAGRTMVTALGGGLRLTAVIEGTFANGRAGDPVHMVIPETVDGWFDANGRRVA